MSERHKIGVVRPARGLPCVKEQAEILKDAGVSNGIYWGLGWDEMADIVNAFRHGDDLLVVPFLGVLGKYRHDLLAGIGEKGADLYDANTGKLYPLRDASNFREIEKACRVASTAPGLAAIAESNNKRGPKGKLIGQEDDALADWCDPEQAHLTNPTIADKYGVTEQTLARRFGSRSKCIAAGGSVK